MCYYSLLRCLPSQSLKKGFVTSGVASVDNWRGEYSYIIFCIINFFWNWLFLRSVNTNVWIFAPPIIDAGYASDGYFLTLKQRWDYFVNLISHIWMRMRLHEFEITLSNYRCIFNQISTLKQCPVSAGMRRVKIYVLSLGVHLSWTQIKYSKLHKNMLHLNYARLKIYYINFIYKLIYLFIIFGSSWGAIFSSAVLKIKIQDQISAVNLMAKTRPPQVPRVPYRSREIPHRDTSDCCRYRWNRWRSKSDSFLDTSRLVCPSLCFRRKIS